MTSGLSCFNYRLKALAFQEEKVERYLEVSEAGGKAKTK
jgi:hypothetical protein